MKLSLSLLILGAAFSAAELPKKAPITKYTGLWINSPFTTKPPPAAVGPDLNPLDDYALGGISPITGGHRITLLNRKNPEERITVDSDRKSDFTILSVTRKPGDPMGTVVRLSTSANKQGNVTFDPTLLTLKAAPAAQPVNGQQPPGIPGAPGQPGQPGQPNQPVQPGQPNPQPGANGAPVRQPRARVVPPTGNNNANRPANNAATPGTAQPQRINRR